MSYVLAATEQDRDAVQGYPARLGAPNQLLQLAVCCNQAGMEASARPASKAAAKRVWVPDDKQKKLREETASASASAETEAKETEKKATARPWSIAGPQRYCVRSALYNPN